MTTDVQALGEIITELVRLRQGLWDVYLLASERSSPESPVACKGDLVETALDAVKDLRSRMAYAEGMRSFERQQQA